MFSCIIFIVYLHTNFPNLVRNKTKYMTFKRLTSPILAPFCVSMTTEGDKSQIY